MRILLISDTHGPCPQDIIPYIENVDEVWHAGDLGESDFDMTLPKHIVFRAVFGNIDDHLTRAHFPETQVFEVEGLKVAMIHIGGYPGRYTAKGKKLIQDSRPDLFVSGHSHILKIVRDQGRNLIHINPGAVGYKGFHQKRTAVRFCVDQGRIDQVEVIELGKRGILN